MWPNLQETEDLVTFTEEIHNGKLHYFVQCFELQTEPPFKWRIFPKGYLQNPQNLLKMNHVVHLYLKSIRYKIILNGRVHLNNITPFSAYSNVIHISALHLSCCSPDLKLVGSKNEETFSAKYNPHCTLFLSLESQKAVLYQFLPHQLKCSFMFCEV